MAADKKDPKAEATREMMELLKSKDLDPEEYKKILTIATSIDHPGAGQEAAREPSNLWKATMVAIGILGLMLMGVAFLMLKQIQESTKKAGPPASRPPGTLFY